MNAADRESGPLPPGGTPDAIAAPGARPAGEPPPFHEAFARLAAAAPDAIAVTDHRQSVTYRELDAHADRFADWLSGQGVGPGRVVGLLMERSWQAVGWVLAVLKSGGTFLLLDPGLDTERLGRMTATAGAELVVTDGDAATTPDAADAPDCRFVSTAALPRGGPTPAPPRQALPGDLAYITHTSGSTREPKAVGISHRSLAVAADGWLDGYRLRDRPMTHLQYAGIGFDVFIQDLARCLLSGGTLAICPPEVRLDPPALAGFLAARRVGFAEFTPSLLLLLTEYLELGGRTLPEVGMVAVGGEPWRVAEYHRLERAFPRASIVNTYGLAEATIDNLMHLGPPPPGTPADQMMPLGRPHPGTEAVVVEPRHSRVVTEGTGELYLAGDCVGSGYLGRPELTAERFVPDPRGGAGRALRTGDLVRIARDGGISYLGRLDDQVKVRGVRVALGEVEAVLATHPAVRQAAVVAAAGPGGTQLVAHVAAEERTDRGALSAWVRASLVAEAVPAKIVLHDRLPVNANGKVDRTLLVREPDRDAAPPDAGPAAEPGDAGRDLGPRAVAAAAWQQVFGREDFAAGDNFFALGGDSVAAARVALLVSRDLGAHVPATTLYGHPTFGSFTDRLAAGQGPPPRLPRRPDPSVHPLSPGQRRLWLHNRISPDSTDYTVPTVLELTGELDRAALGAALDGLVGRHPALRTLIDRGEPVARVLPPEPVRVEEAAADGAEAVRAEIAAFLRRPFDLSRDLPFRALLVSAGGRRHWLVFAIHHTATDQESERVLLDELGRLYDQEVTGAPAVLPAPGTAYGDVAAWRASREGAPEAAERIAARQAELSGGDYRPLPLEAPGGGQVTGTGALVSRTLGRRTTERLREVVRGRGTTVFVALMSAFAETAARWSGGQDLCVGYPEAARDLPGVRDTVGFFVETSVLRVRLAGEPAFGALLEQVHARVAEEAAGPRVPFERIADALAAARDPRDRVFSVWFNHLGAALRPPAMTGLSTAVRASPVPPALFDLNVYVTEDEDDIRVELVRDVARCGAAAAEELLDQFLALLAAALAEPDAPLRGHRPLTARGHAVLPDPTRPPAGTGRPPESLARLLLRTARTRPSAPAVTDGRNDYSYAGLRRSTTLLRGALDAAGVRSGDVVAVLARRSAALVPAVLGTLASGGRLMLLDQEYPDRRLLAQLAAARPGCLVVLDAGERHEALARETGCAVVALAPGGAAGLLRPASGDHRPDNFPGPGYVAFTSGSGGAPVGVLGGPGPLEHFLQWYPAEFGLGPDDRYALLAGLSHDPLYRDVLLGPATGGTVCVPPAELLSSPPELLEWLTAQRVTVLNLTPQLAGLLAGAAGGGRRTLRDVRLVCLGGDRVGQDVVGRLAALAPDAVLVNGYGTTETPQLASRLRLRPGAQVSLGSGAPGSQLLVADASGERCAIGEPGRIVVRGRHLAEGLLRAGGDRSAGLQPDEVPGVRRFDTGDRGRFRTDGTVVFLGRYDGVAKVSGHRVHPGEVDEVLAREPAIATAVTVVRPGGPDGDELVSYVLPAGGRQLTVAWVRARLAAALPVHLLPRWIVPVTGFPLTANGKIDRARLPEPAGQRSSGRPAEPPSTPLEKRLAAIWSVVLGVPDPGVTDNFFDIGGTSLRMAAVHTGIRRELRTEVPFPVLYQHPTVRGLARRLEDLTGAAAPAGGQPSRAVGGEGGGGGVPAPRQAWRGAESQRTRRLRARRATPPGSTEQD